MKATKLLAVAVMAAGLLMFSAAAYADVCDLTGEGGGDQTMVGQYCNDSSTPAGINGAYFQVIDPQATGSGLIDPFVRVSPGGSATESHAYNTTVNNTLDVDSTDQFNHELILADVPIVDIGGTDYYEFVLDANESSGGQIAEEYLSIDEIQVFWSGTPNQSVETFDGSGVLQLADATLVYRLDAGTDSVILLDYSINEGSGSGDMNMYIPVSVFNTGDPFNAYVYLYTHFGGEGIQGDRNYGQSDGFEEWTHREAEPVPEPMTLLLLGTGLLGVGRQVRRRMKKS